MVCPAGMITEAGDTVALVVSDEVKLIVTGEEGACESDTAKFVNWPRGKVIAAAGTLTVPALCTVTFAVPSVTPAALARMTVLPNPAPVTGTGTVLELAGMTTVAGKVATAVLSELRVTVRATVVTPDRLRVAVCVQAPVIV